MNARRQASARSRCAQRAGQLLPRAPRPTCTACASRAARSPACRDASRPQKPPRAKPDASRAMPARARRAALWQRMMYQSAGRAL